MKRALALPLLAALAACPTSYGFNGHIVTPHGDGLQVIDMTTNAPISRGMVPVANATVKCSTCKTPITVDAQGKFLVHLDGDTPLQLTVEAPGYRPVELDITKPPGNSQLGYAHYIVVLAKAQ